MSFYKELLAQGVKGLTSDDFFKAVLKAVADAESTDLSGPQKRELVLNDLKDAAKDIIVPVINLAIEVGVLFIANKAPVISPVIQTVGGAIEDQVDLNLKKL